MQPLSSTRQSLTWSDREARHRGARDAGKRKAMVDPSPDGGTLFRVLVADDSPETRELLFEALSVIGCAVTCVKDGLEALASLQARPYDLLVADYQMPRLNW